MSMCVETDLISVGLGSCMCRWLDSIEPSRQVIKNAINSTPPINSCHFYCIMDTKCFFVFFRSVSTHIDICIIHLYKVDSS